MLNNDLEKNLKPCPFCGGKNIQYETKTRDLGVDEILECRIFCTQCGAEIYAAGLPCVARAAKKWNRRAGKE